MNVSSGVVTYRYGSEFAHMYIDGKRMVLKLSQYLSIKSLCMCLVSLLTNNPLWIDRYFKHNNYQFIVGFLEKIVFSSHIHRFICQYSKNRDKYSAQTIQRYWRRAIVDPKCTICIRRLTHEFNELSNV
jgi:hypothetical protein